MPDLLVLGVIFCALLFGFINGFHDAANAIATSVLTRALSMRNAIIMAAGLNVLGAVAFERVARTIGKGIVDPIHVSSVVVLPAILGAIVWSLICWWLGLPVSQSHSLIGGIIGAVIAANTSLGFINGELFFPSSLEFQ